MAQVVHKVSAVVVRERIRATPEEIAAFCRARHIRWLALFGSVLRDDFTDDSDIDSVVEFGPPHSSDYWGADLWDDLSDLFGGRKAELVNFRHLHWRFRDRVLAHVETLYGVMPEDASTQFLRGLSAEDMRKDDRVYVATMLDSAQEVTKFIASKTRMDYDSDEALQHALAQCVTQMGRAAQRASSGYRDRYPNIPWEVFTQTLNKITYPMHAEWRSIVWSIVSTYWPSLVIELEQMVPPEMRAEP